MSNAKKDRERLPLSSTHRRVNCSPPPPAPPKHTDVQQEIVPDSEPERTGNDGYDSMSEPNEPDAEQSDGKGENSETEQEESQGLDLVLDHDEMELDPFANEFEDQDQGLYF